MTEHVRHDAKLNFSIVAEPSSHFVEFKIYEIVGHDFDSRDNETFYWQKAGSDSTDPTDVFAEAEVYLHGSVKWDGCSNWHFDAQDDAMLHECGRDGLKRYGDVMVLCWDWAIDLMPETTICEK